MGEERQFLSWDVSMGYRIASWGRQYLYIGGALGSDVSSGARRSEGTPIAPNGDCRLFLSLDPPIGRQLCGVGERRGEGQREHETSAAEGGPLQS